MNIDPKPAAQGQAALVREKLETIEAALTMHATNAAIRAGKAPPRTKAWRGEYVEEKLADALTMAREALDALGATQGEPQRVREAWPYLLQTIAVSDHLGDVADALRSFAAVVGLPQPPDEALEDWHEHIKAEHGVEDGIFTFRAELAKKAKP